VASAAASSASAAWLVLLAGMVGRVGGCGPGLINKVASVSRLAGWFVATPRTGLRRCVTEQRVEQLQLLA